MGRTSKWGSRSFKKGNADDDRIKMEILGKLKDLGETGHEDKKNVSKPDTIHSMNSNWQQYSAPAFGKAVRECRQILSKILHLFYIYFILFYLTTTTTHTSPLPLCNIIRRGRRC